MRLTCNLNSNLTAQPSCSSLAGIKQTGSELIQQAHNSAASIPMPRFQDLLKAYTGSYL